LLTLSWENTATWASTATYHQRPINNTWRWLSLLIFFPLFYSAVLEIYSKSFSIKCGTNKFTKVHNLKLDRRQYVNGLLLFVFWPFCIFLQPSLKDSEQYKKNLKDSIIVDFFKFSANIFQDFLATLVGKRSWSLKKQHIFFKIDII
jgi:hypothetical protein